MKWLYGLQLNGIKLGLTNIRSLLRRMGNPQDSFPCIHVAGSDGKGSTCAIMASVLRAKGLRVGLYTSPHILEFRERITVNGEAISDADLSRIVGGARHFVDDMRESDMSCTFFEVTTAVAFQYFRERQVDVAVVEVGMGGRFDATNVIRPLVSVISNISMEHMEYLGDTIEKIAYEKAGIIKDGVPAVTINSGAALDVVSQAAAERNSPLTVIDAGSIAVTKNSERGVEFTYKGESYFVSIPGRNEAKNAVLALESLRAIGDRFGDLSEALAKGMGEVVWPCRMELTDDDIILDVTHTRAGSDGLVRDISEIYGRTVLVFGILSDKDAPDICENLSKIASKVVVTAPDCPRARPAEETLAIMRRYVPGAQMAPSVGEAIELGLNIRMPGEKLLVTGSFYMVEEALRWKGRTSL
ncbi:folylpolyglutamate synthase/dihydrofolate synthase [Thermoplasmatales archaeon BRNA1]|nr:folylpolyglutamate synthase/dihydrofolate synthase [Thermoplasmatales archaeon BRNA1]